MQTTITFGTASEHVAIVFQSSSGQSENEWLKAEARIAAHPFKGTVEFFSERRDWVQFREELEELHRTLTGSAQLRTREDQLALKLDGNGLGGIDVSGHAYAHATYGNFLQFNIEIDQTFLAAPIEALGRMLATHDASQGVR